MVGSFSRYDTLGFSRVLQDDTTRWSISPRDIPEAWGFAHLSQSSNIFISQLWFIEMMVILDNGRLVWLEIPMD
jgi:predicted nucleic-acid-binding protein